MKGQFLKEAGRVQENQQKMLGHPGFGTLDFLPLRLRKGSSYKYSERESVAVGGVVG